MSEVLEATSEMLYSDIRRSEKKYRSSSSTQYIPYSIDRVPATLRQLKPSAYTPRVVSIGLLHLEHKHLQSMNEHKESYMNSLFHRTAKSQETREYDVDETVRKCVDAMLLLAPSAWTCYPPVPFDADSIAVPPPVLFVADSIARTMLVDGCFILELLMRSSKDKREISDPIFGNNLVFLDVQHDLLLLENQIPFFVLEQLFELTVERIQNQPNSLSLTHLILQFFGNMMNFDFKLTIKDSKNEDVDHILGLLHSCYRPGESDPGEYSIMKYSATDLHRSGVNFKPSKGDDFIYLRVHFQTRCLFSWLPNIRTHCQFPWLLAITRTISKTKSSCFRCFSKKHSRELPVSAFERTPRVSIRKRIVKPRCCLFSCLCQLCCRPNLEIPQLHIYDITEPFLRNLIAFEQCSQNTPRHFTSYAFLMNTLINSKEHFELLERAEVLKNYLVTSEDASNLFNNLCKEVRLGEFYFSQQWKQVDCYCKLYWPSFMRTYLSSVWSGISIIAALFLFAFTGIQTICSLISLLK